jgi:MoxR-like ATPase
LHGRFHVTTEDIIDLAKPVLRHRIVCSFAAQANGITSDTVIQRLIDHFNKKSTPAEAATAKAAATRA